MVQKDTRHGHILIVIPTLSEKASDLGRVLFFFCTSKVVGVGFIACFTERLYFRRNYNSTRLPAHGVRDLCSTKFNINNLNYKSMGLDITICKAKKDGLAESLDRCAELSRCIREITTRIESATDTDKTDLEQQANELQHEYDNTLPYIDVAYFRKTNFLMAFFDDFDNGEYLEISKDEVDELLNNCERVLADHSLAPELLPTQEGFFFGSTDYDEEYFDKVRNVLDTFTMIMEIVDLSEYSLFITAWW